MIFLEYFIIIKSELSKTQLQKYKKYSEKQTYKLNDTIRSKISESSRKAKKYTSFRVCCGRKGNEETAVFQVEQEALADTLQQGATVEIINAKISSKFGRNVLSVGKMGRAEWMSEKPFSKVSNALKTINCHVSKLFL